MALSPDAEKKILKKVLNGLVNVIFPETCPTCKGRSDEHMTAPLCSQCWGSIPPYTGPQCSICGIPFMSPYGITCKECILSPPPFERARFFGLYEGPLKHAIKELKFFRKKRLSRPLAHFLPPYIPDTCEAIVPVPIHPNRLRHRQFNQSALIAKGLSNLSSIPLIWDSLLKIKETRPQVGLNVSERRENVRNSFGVINTDAVKNKRILLIDDVITTGATVKECAKILRIAGAREIHVLTLSHG